MSDLYERLQPYPPRRATSPDTATPGPLNKVKGYPDRLHDKVAVSYRDLPGFPIPTAIGHAGTAYSTRMGDNRVLMLFETPAEIHMAKGAGRVDGGHVDPARGRHGSYPTARCEPAD